MAALAVDPDPRRRLIVELLARTGMRVGELGALADDAVVRMGDTFWLQVPVGKLHNDRYVPLHPIVVELITDYARREGDHGRVGLLNATTVIPSTGALSTVTSTPSPNMRVSVTCSRTSSDTRSRPKRSIVG